MWETITLAEIKEAKAQLSRKREEALSRQAAEIRSLDAQLDDIESFERVVAAFFEEHMGEGAPCDPPSSVPQEATTASFTRADEDSSPRSSPNYALPGAPNSAEHIAQSSLSTIEGSSLAMNVAIPSE